MVRPKGAASAAVPPTAAGDGRRDHPESQGSSEENQVPRKSKDVIAKAITRAGKAISRLLTQADKSHAENDNSVRTEIRVGTEVSLSADSHRHGGGGGVLKA